MLARNENVIAAAARSQPQEVELDRIPNSLLDDNAKASERCSQHDSPTPRRTGREDFPHPALPKTSSQPGIGNSAVDATSTPSPYA